MGKSLYEKAKAEMPKEEIDHYCSTLYLKKTEVSDRLISEYEYKASVRTFKDNIDHVPWYEIAFAYEPYFSPNGHKAT